MKKLIYEHIAIFLVIVLCVFSYSIIIVTAGVFGGGLDGDSDGMGPTDGGGDKSGSVYYFNNAVNTSPEEIGNYWYDAEVSNPAQEIPDLSQNELHILDKAEYEGNPTFINSGENSGTVNGDAIFVGDLSENNGSITGSKTRVYNGETETETSRDFTNDSWIVKADGINLNVTGATYNSSTTFIRENSGSFTSNMVATSASVNDKTLTIQYNTSLDTEVDSPVIGDFSVKINGNNVSIDSIAISGTTVTLTLGTSAPAGSTVTATYNSGNNPVLSSNGLNAPSFTDMAVTVQTPAQNNNSQDNNQNNISEESSVTPSRSSTSLPLSLLNQANNTVESLNKTKVVSLKDVVAKEDSAKVSADEVKKEDSTNSKIVEKSSDVSTGSGSSVTIEAEVKVAPTPEVKAVIEKLASKILLAVEDKGTVWYVAPNQGQRYEVSKDNAINVFRNTSLGITNKDLEKIPVAGTSVSGSALGNRLVGRFLLQVESRGETWYVSPNGQRVRVTPDNIVDVTKQSAIGITNNNLVKIPTTK